MTNKQRRVYPLLLAAGAIIPQNPAEYLIRIIEGDPYLREVAAVGFPAYEKAHRTRLAATFAKVFRRLPVDAVSHVVAFAFHAGHY